MNILFTCGGTAGHVNPAVALARIFQDRQPGCRILFVGADGGMENKLVPREGVSDPLGDHHRLSPLHVTRRPGP